MEGNGAPQMEAANHREKKRTSKFHSYVEYKIAVLIELKSRIVAS